MKRIFCCTFIICALVLSLTTSVYATGTTEYVLDEVGIEISMPDDYVVFLREINANDPNLSEYGLTKDSLYSLMNDRNIYLDAWDADINNEIIVTMQDSSLGDFNLFSDTTLSTMATSLKGAFENVGITVIKTEIYQHAQAKFLKIFISQKNGGSTEYGLQYYTVYADKAINITILSYSGEINSSQEALIKSIVDSAEFNTVPQKADTIFTPTDAFTYTDEETKATFVVPANWVEEPLSKEREFIDVKFTSLEEAGLCIIYGGTDLWNEISESERRGYSRLDMDNDFLTKSEISAFLGIESNESEYVVYGGKKYYSAVASLNSDANGIDLTSTVTYMICIENGYVHMFQFNGEKGSKYYDDFESILASMEFAPSIGEENSKAESKINSLFDFFMILCGLMVTVVAYSFPIIVYRYAEIKEPVEKKKAKKITIIYGTCALIVSAIILLINGSAITGCVILLWTWVNYRILIGGKSESQAQSETEQETSANPSNNRLDSISTKEESESIATDCLPVDSPRENICQSCGARLPAESFFCHKCGANIRKKEN